jgi:hypothetical protein
MRPARLSDCLVLPLLVLSLAIAVAQAAGQGAPPRDSTTSSGPPPAAPHRAAEPADGVQGSMSLMGIWIAAAHHSSFSTRRGIKHHDLYLLGLRGGWTVATWSHASLDYTIDIVPAAIMTGNPNYTPVITPCPPGAVCAAERQMVPSYHTVYGFGLAPAGIQLQLFPNAPVQLLLDVSGGVLWFAHPVPDPEATRFNFTAEFGGAVRWSYSAHHALLVGYKLHHTSNAGTGTVNPGLNSGMLYVGFMRRRY